MAQRFSILLLSSLFPNAIRSDQVSTGTPKPGVQLQGLLVDRNGQVFLLGDKGFLFVKTGVKQGAKKCEHMPGLWTQEILFSSYSEPLVSGCSSVVFQGPKNVIKSRSKNGQVWAMVGLTMILLLEQTKVPEMSNLTSLPPPKFKTSTLIYVYHHIIHIPITDLALLCSQHIFA